jgi:Ca-activated chloride channel family protein
MRTNRFTEYIAPDQTPFEKLFAVFKELIIHTSGDVEEALDWLRELDAEYKLTSPDYTMEDFIEDLKQKGYLRESMTAGPGMESALTPKALRALKDYTLDQLFGKLQPGMQGNHRTKAPGNAGDEAGNLRDYQFGDGFDKIALTESIRKAQTHQGPDGWTLTDRDLVVYEDHKSSQMATVLMIDISHSMILYGEDRITPAKKVAMALASLIEHKYPRDFLDVVVFGDDAWPVSVGELPFLKVGPYHTNTVAGLQLAMDILRRRRVPNKQIFMITDGKPSCIREADGTYYKNSFGLDEYIVGQCLRMAGEARRLRIPITTFMIARDAWLQEFVRQFAEANQGKALFTGLNGLGQFVFEDYERNRKKNIR